MKNKLKKRPMTEWQKLTNKASKLARKAYKIKEENEKQNQEFLAYIKRHPSLDFDKAKIETGDVGKLKKIYEYFDTKHFHDCEFGLRYDDRGMKLTFYPDCEDADYLVFVLDSTSENICFGGTSEWFVYAPTFEDKIKAIRQIKKDISEILLDKKEKAAG